VTGRVAYERGLHELVATVSTTPRSRTAAGLEPLHRRDPDRLERTGLGADAPADDIELGEFAGLGDPERIVVNVETV